MTTLLKLRSERGQMSAIERRIADFILDNAHLLRDYSSQQLANTLKVSQSSVVKFSQKLGYRGYPDLKFSIGEALARDAASGEDPGAGLPAATDPAPGDADGLWQAKVRAEEESRLLNDDDTLAGAAARLVEAETLYLGGTGTDAGAVQALALRLALLGRRCVVHADPAALLAALTAATPGDRLLLVCEHGNDPGLLAAATAMHAAGGRVLALTRHCANPLRAHADQVLLVSAIDARPELEPLLFQAVAQQLLDVLYLRVHASRPGTAERHPVPRARLRVGGRT